MTAPFSGMDRVRGEDRAGCKASCLQTPLQCADSLEKTYYGRVREYTNLGINVSAVYRSPFNYQKTAQMTVQK